MRVSQARVRQQEEDGGGGSHLGVEVVEGAEEGSQDIPDSILLEVDAAVVSCQDAKEVATSGILLDHVDVLLVLKCGVELDDVVVLKGYVDPDLSFNLVPEMERRSDCIRSPDDQLHEVDGNIFQDAPVHHTELPFSIHL